MDPVKDQIGAGGGGCGGENVVVVVTEPHVNQPPEDPQSLKNEDTVTSGEWRTGDDDTYTGTGGDSITPLKRQYYGFLNKKKHMLDGSGSSRSKDQLSKDAVLTHIIQIKKTEWKLMVFVLFLFILIIAGLVTIYHLQEDEHRYLHRSHNFVVDKKTLQVEIKNREGQMVLTGALGMKFLERPSPYDCSYTEEGKESEKLCLLWKNKRKLEVEHFNTGLTTCHRIRWTVLSADVAEDQKDCFDLADAKWYGGGILKNVTGTLDAVSVARQPVITRGVQDVGVLGPVAERYWVSSEGVAITAGVNSTIEFSINAFDVALNYTDRQFCLYSARNFVPYSSHSNFELSYYVCASDDVRQVRADTLPLFVPNSSPRLVSDLIFKAPVWSTWANFKERYNQTVLGQFADQILTSGFTPGHLMLDDGWETVTGDLEFPSSGFPNPKDMVERLHVQGFNVSLQIRPQLSLNSNLFHSPTVQGYLVQDFGGDVPCLTQWWTGPQWDPRGRNLAGIIDVTDAGFNWQMDRLLKFQREYGVDTFHMIGNEVTSLPAYSSLRGPILDYNDFTRLNVELVSRFGSLASAESASRSQHLGVPIRIRGGTSTWNGLGGLQSVIPSALTLGILGYPFFIPDSIGGSGYNRLPAKELYIRWLQLSAFLPVIHFSIPPDHYDEEVRNLVKEVLGIRNTLVIPEVLSLIRSQNNTVQSPIIRPIWWNDPEDKEALGIVSEFLLGDRILIAPILEEGERKRDIYLTKGLWRDEHLGVTPLSGVTHTGPIWLRGYSVSLSKVAYFIRQ